MLGLGIVLKSYVDDCKNTYDFITFSIWINRSDELERLIQIEYNQNDDDVTITKYNISYLMFPYKRL